MDRPDTKAVRHARGKLARLRAQGARPRTIRRQLLRLQKREAAKYS